VPDTTHGASMRVEANWVDVEGHKLGLGTGFEVSRRSSELAVNSIAFTGHSGAIVSFKLVLPTSREIYRRPPILGPGPFFFFFFFSPNGINGNFCPADTPSSKSRGANISRGGGGGGRGDPCSRRQAPLPSFETSPPFSCSQTNSCAEGRSGLASTASRKRDVIDAEYDRAPSASRTCRLSEFHRPDEIGELMVDAHRAGHKGRASRSAFAVPLPSDLTSSDLRRRRRPVRSMSTWNCATANSPAFRR